MTSVAVGTVFIVDDDGSMRQAIHDLVESVERADRDETAQARGFARAKPGQADPLFDGVCHSLSGAFHLIDGNLNFERAFTIYDGGHCFYFLTFRLE